MFEPEEKDIKKKCEKIFTLQKKIFDSCSKLKELVRKKNGKLRVNKTKK
jgi:hypothetical protein